jgi:hypothetical protein
MEWKYVEDGTPAHGGQVLVSFMVGTNGPFVTSARYEKKRWDWNSSAANKYRSGKEIYAWAEMPVAARRKI